jgi:hypothetical protein
MARIATIMLALGLAAPVSLVASHEAPAPATKQHKESPQSVAFVRFYEKRYGEGKNLCTISIPSRPFTTESSMSSAGCTNDEANSVKFENLPANSTVAVFNNPNCSRNYDWTIIYVLKSVPQIVVPYFERTEEWTEWRMVYTRDDGDLNGKVSCFQIHVPALDASEEAKPAAASPGSP